MNRNTLYTPHPSLRDRVAELENKVAALEQRAETQQAIIEAQQDEIERLRRINTPGK